MEEDENVEPEDRNVKLNPMKPNLNGNNMRNNLLMKNHPIKKYKLYVSSIIYTS